MGYNTTVFILNDFLGEIKKNPQTFVDELANAINSGEETYIMGQTKVMQSLHADVQRVYYTHGNSIMDLSSFPKRRSDYWIQMGVAARALIQTVKKNWLIEQSKALR